MRKVLTAKSAKNYAMNAKISVLYGENYKVKSTFNHREHKDFHKALSVILKYSFVNSVFFNII